MTAPACLVIAVHIFNTIDFAFFKRLWFHHISLKVRVCVDNVVFISCKLKFHLQQSDIDNASIHNKREDKDNNFFLKFMNHYKEFMVKFPFSF